MLHGNNTKQLGRERKTRNALLKTLAVSFIKHGKIQTTEIKAKVLKSRVEKLITAGKAGSVHAQRMLSAKIGPVAAAKIVKEISPKYKDRNGGYTRVIKLGQRLSDGAKMAQIELV
jgi:large subunit ribosomal protein L17